MTNVKGPVAAPATPLLDPPDGIEVTKGLYPVAYIAEFQGPGLWPFHEDKARVTIGNGPRNGELPPSPGTPDADIVIPGRQLSASHCTLERRTNSVRIYDLASTNGTYVGHSKITSWDVHLGAKFSPWPMTLFLMDRAMAKYRDELTVILGRGHSPSADTLLTEVVRQTGHIIISGPPGCGHTKLASAIHKMSLRSALEPVMVDSIPEDRAEQAKLVKSASKPKNTFFLPIPKRYKAGTVDASFLASLYAPDYGIRVIATATTEDDAERVLPRQAFLMSYRINLRPLALRSAEIDSLLDYYFLELGAPHLRSADLTADNLAALHAYSWPRNLDELHDVAEAIVLLDQHGGLRGASRATDSKLSKVRDTLARPGISMHRVGDASADVWTVFVH